MTFRFKVSGLNMDLEGMGLHFSLRRNDLKRRGGGKDGSFWDPGANPEGYGSTYEKTWTTGPSLDW